MEQSSHKCFVIIDCGMWTFKGRSGLLELQHHKKCLVTQRRLSSILLSVIVTKFFCFAIIFANFSETFAITKIPISFRFVSNFDIWTVSYFAKHETTEKIVFCRALILSSTIFKNIVLQYLHQPDNHIAVVFKF